MFFRLFPQRPHTARPGPSRRPQRRAFRPGLEALEDRCVPSTLAVTSTDDNVNEAGTLRFAVAHATSGDTILLTRAVQVGITLTHGDLVLTQNVTIETTPGPRISISGGGNSRIFEINAGVQVTLNNLELTQGNGTANNPADTSDLDGNGGAILDFGTLTINNGRLDNNSADDGGGAILSFSGNVTVNETIISDNSAPGTKAGGFGGGIWNFLGTLTVNKSLFSGNLATHGGGGILNEGQLTVSNSSFLDNTTDGSSEGGGIWNFGTMTASNCLFVGNVAGFGGGIFNDGGTVTVTGSTFANNTGLLDGGAIYNAFGGSLSVGTSVFAGNTPENIVGPFTDLGGNVGVT
jgi:predicted outer membrane repeat protein